ncbi:MAG TPA: PQQ-binding-like beta-propeller repeat protein [Candidatus Didemnitutus sp.]|nr:PQQ-binding-like beta-propeller repeat protein [Candidatus Didemnitutus sp.]
MSNFDFIGARHVGRLGFVLLALGLWIPFIRADSPAVDPIEGTWMGSVTAPQGDAQIGFRFARNAHGDLNFSLYFPLMNTFGATFDVPVTRSGAHYSEPVLKSQLNLDGDQLKGTFGPGKLPMVLTRGGTFAPAPPPPVYPAAPTVAWRQSLGAPTWASPVYVEGTVYVGNNKGLFFSIDGTDGKIRWTWTGPNRIDGKAVVADGALYFVDGKNDLVCLDAASGVLRWRSALYDEKRAGKPLAENPTFNRRTATPRVEGKQVLCGSADGGLYSLDAATGRVKWRFEAGAPIFSGIGNFGPNQVTFGTMDGSVVAVDLAHQTEVYRAKTGGGVVTTPIMAGDMILAGSRDYFLYAFRASDRTVAWRFSYWFSWVESTGALRDGIYYVGASDYRRVIAFEPTSGRTLWATDVGGMDWGTPLVTGKSVFIGTVAQNIPGTAIVHRGGIMALDRSTGKPRWQLPAAPAPENGFGGYAGSLATDGKRIFAAGFDGDLIALPAE